MKNNTETDLDAALAALARELSEAEPRPDPALTAGVMADAALTAFAAEARAAAPRPGQQLVARVLADAAAVAAERRAPASRPAATAARGGGIVEWLFGWTGGAVAAMVLGLVVGLGVGFEAGPGSLPMLDPVDSGLPMALAEADPGILLMDGL